MRTRLSALAAAGLACLPATAAANASAVCTPQGGIEVRLEHFVAGRTINATIQVGGLTPNPVTFTGPSYVLVIPGPTPAPWTGSVSWWGTRSLVSVPLAGPACSDDGTYRPVPEPTPTPPAVPVSSPPVVVADTTPPVMVEAPVPTPPPSPTTTTPPPTVVGPPMVPPRHRPAVRRWPAVACRPGRVWGRRADRTVYRCLTSKPRVPAVTG